MNELNKLIQQYETENPGKKGFIPERLGFREAHYSNHFIVWAISELASRPTCSKNERAFLDEIRDKGVSDWRGIYIDGESHGASQLYQEHFKSNLKELVNDT